MDGWITIGTQLSTDKFDRQINDLEKKIQDEEDKKLIIETKLQGQETEFKEAIQETDKYADALERVQKLKQVIAGQNATPEQFTQYQDLTRAYGTEEQLTKSFDKALSKQDKLEQQLIKTRQDYDVINNKVDQYKQKIEGIRLQKHQKDIEEMKKSFNNVGGSLQHSLKSLSRLALSIIGIRSLLLGVRQAVSMLSQYNEDLANKIEAIKLALASALAPLIEFIVDLLTKAVALLGFVLKTLFGVDIFAKASAMSLKKATGSAKELRKQLAGFDEMNVLNADGTTNLGGVGGLSKTIEDMNALGESMFKKIQVSIDGAKEAFGNFVNDLQVAFSPLAGWVYDNVWIPMKRNFGVVIKTFEPLLDPLKKAWDEMINQYLKPLWDGFVDYMKPNVIDPIIDYFRPIGMQIYNFILPYINAIIDWINETFGIFGVHLDHWEYQTTEAIDNVEGHAKEKGDELEEDLNDPLANAITKATILGGQKIDIQTNTQQIDELDLGIQGILDNLWQLVKQPWNIVTKIVAKGSSSLNNFLQPLRDTLSNIGIKLPFLATGGIVNMPNKGTYIGGAIAGESGREGVLPLTDQQAMAELGREIGRNVLVNLTNVTSMNGRIISRELKQVQSEQDFAYNI